MAALPEPTAADAPRLALITGGSRGLGAAIALQLARDGWNIALTYRQQAPAADAVVAAVKATGRQGLALRCDVAQEAEVLAVFAQLDEQAPQLGALRGLVNNAGIVAPGARLDAMEVARWQRILAVNVLGPMLCCREALRRMSRRHGGPGGAIVNLSSRAAQMGAPGIYVDYASSKGALDTLTVGLAREVAAEGVRVNGVRPGIIDTDIHADSGDALGIRSVAAQLPMQRLGAPEEVAAAVGWLMSPAASYVTGAILDVSGGR